MNNYELMGAVNALYDVNDRMGVELMGAPAWNGLKKAVVVHTANVLKGTCGGELLGASLSDILKKATKVVSSSIYPKSAKFALGGKNFQVTQLNGTDALTRQLFGFNDDLGYELLGGWWTDAKNAVTGATHQILNVGSKIPVVDAAVERFRDITGVITGGKKAVDTATVVYDNRGKIILIGGAAAILLYMLLRKKK